MNRERKGKNIEGEGRSRKSEKRIENLSTREREGNEVNRGKSKKLDVSKREEMCGKKKN